ncbi:hypothetical protein MVES1_002246 [Malassezia vespertilionis]|uniref:Uncharacterized protein n=1 Tax=Malassezia vespertilionis TaxID=2020962 RepID=A0A2N1JC63_9BASI|nr:uncharacterized protein MVES1_002246 [Malassezia vespertilionis]PKI84150.1 hypothetical protein MVES_002120 [Malassezia vespertilionis]WFD06891.1 hypothetical protein MVES1_002246 [Malassezia vespertilionis]
MCLLLRVLGCAVGSQAWARALAALGSDDEIEFNAYSDMHYYNARSKGVSFQVEPVAEAGKVLTVDLYNKQPKWGTLTLPIKIIWEEHTFVLEAATTALDMVRAFGEPTRKGGGDAGGTTAKALGPAMWLEWALAAPQGVDAPTLYVLAEYGGEPARAKDRWEAGRGSSAVWATLALSIVPV